VKATKRFLGFLGPGAMILNFPAELNVYSLVGSMIGCSTG
jgi:hypothetical protein